MKVILIVLATVIVLAVGRLQFRNRKDCSQKDRRRERQAKKFLEETTASIGYVARKIIESEELRQLVEEGSGPDELAALIANRIEDLKAPILGYQSVNSLELPVRMLLEHRVRAMYVLGRTGGGKTTCLVNSIHQDMDAGHGVGAISCEQEFFLDEILPVVPVHRIKDVVYINPADTECPVPFNPLHLHEGEDLDLRVDETFSIFMKFFDMGPRMEAILRQMLYTLIPIPNTTLLDVGKLLDPHDASYRQWAVEQIDDPLATKFWLKDYIQYPKDAHLPIMNRLTQFLRPKVIRRMVCAKGCFSIRQAMDSKKIVLVNLSDGVLGPANAQLLGQLIVSGFQIAAMSRADIPKESRVPFFLFIDEFASLVNTGSSTYETILSRARKYRLCLTLAHQQTGQLTSSLLREILGNVGSICCFHVGRNDAMRISKEMITIANGNMVELNPQSLLAIGIGEAFVKIDRSVFYMKTLPPLTNGKTATRDQVIEHSRRVYGLAEESEKPTTVVHNEVERVDPGQVF